MSVLLTTPCQREVGLLTVRQAFWPLFLSSLPVSHGYFGEFSMHPLVHIRSCPISLPPPLTRDCFPKEIHFLNNKKRFDSHFSDFWDLYLLIHQYYHVLNFKKKSHECFITFPSQICVSAHTKTEPLPQGLTPGQGQDEGKANEAYKVQNSRRRSPLNVAST